MFSYVFLQATIYRVLVFPLRNTRHVTFTNVFALVFAPLTSRGRFLAAVGLCFFLPESVSICLVDLAVNE